MPRKPGFRKGRTVGRRHAQHNSRGLGNRRFTFGVTLPRRYFVRFDDIADRLGISRSQVAEAALSLFLMLDRHHAPRA